ncbi:MAG: hypothetical protein WA855_10795, partial [Candidatus Acidiferrales bacterium]
LRMTKQQDSAGGLAVKPDCVRGQSVRHVEVDFFTPRLDILPSSQRLLWDELKATPRTFVL